MGLEEYARVYINYSNDVLIQEDDGRGAVIVQEWGRTPGCPADLVCLRELACLSRDEHAPKTALAGGNRQTALMGDREVSYRDEAGETVRVILR